ncbi:dTDP-4-dehydrorhamnose reductase [Liquorilactobacillus mali]|uniref:dTDP-4-dehydrorhamnose reductase n=1 Tax=Liquorilactobacillus mali KCTC 3596 = DSM 20444 TaxID=1046596 RepID=J1F2K1_9LACO|nr:dTDP-4-dehydrorhamnose reductase [Liquorilactobacillus mali]EJE99280.1 dTDP-4-dehydrorhamnose reductase [Liquorilactobacillus mali KCTC 3596 = DSM 20444]KRN08615.1 dTDP-4-dehydrorhamnose reductase [Liquorilactobacillus mali KCTC 3596 = DSM 20444]MDN7146267.1 dTDP-4-dehydrorhamnose reductase [Liquorilactobacillus mali]QFQ74388.1 dTDP-4-dehydrorhamnose reductase [Liquorilactobacillus mali]
MILVTGGSGQLGSELRYLLDEKKIEYVAPSSKELNITDEKSVMQYVEKLRPSVIYHCAAYTAVDAAEDDGKELNYLVNNVGTVNMAKAAAKVDAIIIYISTDYVFDGNLTDGEYTVEAQTNPLNEYGKAKLAGEKAIQNFASKYYIIRTSWVFGQYGKNFVFTMQRLAKQHPKVTVVADQFGRPTWTRTLAEFMTYAVENHVDYGIYHLSNDNTCTWYDFASEILKDEDVVVEPLTSEQFPQKATRPAHSIMDLSKVKSTGFKIPTWQDALNEMLNRM